MNCETCDSLLLDLVYEELDARTAEQVRAHLAGCTRCAAAFRQVEAGRRLARAMPLAAAPAGVHAVVMARARALVDERAAEGLAAKESTTRNAASVSLEGLLSWMRGLLMGPQVAMALVLLVVVGLGLFWMPKLRQSRRLAGQVVNPPASEELGAAPLSPAEPLELALETPQRRPAGRAVATSEVAGAGRGRAGSDPPSTPSVELTGGEVLEAPLPQVTTLADETQHVAERATQQTDVGGWPLTDVPLVRGEESGEPYAKRGPSRTRRASSDVVPMGDGFGADDARMQTGGRSVSEPLVVAGAGEIELAPGEAVGERSMAARGRGAGAGPAPFGNVGGSPSGVPFGTGSAAGGNGGTVSGTAAAPWAVHARAGTAARRMESESGDPRADDSATVSARHAAPARSSPPPAVTASPPTVVASPSPSLGPQPTAQEANRGETAPTTAGGPHDRGVAREQGWTHGGAGEDAAAGAPRADTGATHPAALHQRARTLAAAGSTREAIAAYEALLARHPNYRDAPQAMLEVADLYRRGGDLVAARRWLTRAEGFPNTQTRARQRLRALDPVDRAARPAAPTSRE